jgi:tetratricopeptide (TPR) repeat protein
MRLGVIINLLIWIGLSASPYLWLGAAPVQASARERGAAQSAQESSSLELGRPIQQELSGGQTHSYKITMTSGHYLQVVVNQQGIDVAVTLFTPDGRKICEVDSKHLVEGSETVSAIAEARGAYLIEVRSPEKTSRSGRYEIKVEELRAATVEDKYRVSGELIFREAGQLQNGTLEAKRKSIEKYHEAVELYRRATDRHMEAVTLNSIGAVYRSLGEPQKALEKYDEALPILQAVGDSSGKADTLNNIGVVYRSLGEPQKALDKYNEALPILQAVGNRSGEADTLTNIGAVYRSLGEMQKALERVINFKRVFPRRSLTSV